MRGWFEALLTLNISIFLAYLLLFFITVAWPYIGSILGTTLGRFRGGKVEEFIPPEIIEDED